MKVVSPIVWGVLCAAVGLLYHSYSDFETTIELDMKTIQLQVKGIDTRLNMYGFTGANEDTPPVAKLEYFQRTPSSKLK